MREAPQKAGDLFGILSAAFREEGVADPAKEAEAITCHALNISRTEFYRDDPPVRASDAERVKSLLHRRVHREPLPYLTGTVDFSGLRIRVGPGVLIPRPETEILVEEVLRTCRDGGHSSPEILDIGTGSGCIALAVSKNMTSARVTGIDRSDRALSYAGENARCHGVKNLHLLSGDLFQPVQGRTFDVMVSNPPYVRRDDLSLLPREVREYEPPEALDGGADGLLVYRAILREAPRHLKEGGHVLLEVGFGQARQVRDIAERCGLVPVRAVRDLSGIDRVLVFRGA